MLIVIVGCDSFNDVFFFFSLSQMNLLAVFTFAVCVLAPSAYCDSATVGKKINKNDNLKIFNYFSQMSLHQTELTNCLISLSEWCYTEKGCGKKQFVLFFCLFFTSMRADIILLQPLTQCLSIRLHHLAEHRCSLLQRDASVAHQHRVGKRNGERKPDEVYLHGLWQHNRHENNWEHRGDRYVGQVTERLGTEYLYPNRAGPRLFGVRSWLYFIYQNVYLAKNKLHESAAAWIWILKKNNYKMW